MKLYLDDIRNPPDDTWSVIRDPLTFVSLLEENWNNIERISLDHDLGFHDDNGMELTGSWVVGEMEVLAMANQSLPFICDIHSANPVGAQNMALGINRLYERFKF